ncbi:hypothetical protein F4779DRAFT_639801 [Xylariaceae sp. FL0662B]|nr:hypothetical protein F4779DRAFT_639801 [Xylariaceae sp. FL0662B]
MTNALQLAVALLAVLPTALGSNLFVHNNCGFAIWCGAAKNKGGLGPTVQVGGSGGVYQSPLPAENDNIGSVLKCATNQALAQPFQMELNVQYGRSWLDLSAVDGDPFLAYHRHAETAGQCVIDCPAGSTACEWPHQIDCDSTENAWLTLC